MIILRNISQHNADKIKDGHSHSGEVSFDEVARTAIIVPALLQENKL